MKKVSISKQIAILMWASAILVVGRIVIFDNYSLVYMLWNLFLAFTPFVVSSVLLWHARTNTIHTALLWIGGVIWLLLLPNAPYLITDLIHIARGQSLLVFYDTVMLFSCAWIGMILALSSISHMDEIFRLRYSNRKTSMLIIGIMLLMSFGIYLGRFLRFNSWDVVTHPLYFFRKVWEIFSHPFEYVDAYVFTLFFFFFLCMAYEAWKNVGAKRNSSL